MLSFPCPHCAIPLQVPEEQAGTNGCCPGCGRSLTFPAATEAPATALSRAATLPPASPPQALSDPVGDARTVPAGNLRGETVGAGARDEPDGRGEELTDFLAPAQEPDEIGRLGPYRVLAVLGHGGMGVVYKAEDPNLQRFIALKAMLPGLAASGSARQRFLREARAAAAVKHEHVVTIHQVGEDHGVPFLAMEFLQGESLDDRLQREGRLPASEVLRIGREIAEGLEAAHEQGLIHRDVKPANVWLEGKKERVKILDFGLARAGGDGSHLTQSGAIVGTPAYMAPEQASGQAVDRRSDLFSLGCVLYRMTTGTPAFQGRDPLSTLMAVVSENPRPPHEVDARVPRALSDLVMRLLAKQADDRPQAAAEVAAALEAIPAPPVPAAAPSAPPRPAPPPEPTLLLGPPRRRWRRAALVVLALALLGAGGFAFLRVLGSGDGGQDRGTEGVEQARPAPLDCTGPNGASALEVRRAQEAWARFLGRAVEESMELAGGVKMTFVLVPPGKFRMGSPQEEKERQADDRDESQHEVTLTEPFDLGKTEVTQAQYEALGLANPSKFKGSDRPVERVSWEEARDWAAKLTAQRRDQRLYRLPTEAEWEYACRGGRSSSQPFGIGDGRTLSSRAANFNGFFPYGDADEGPDLQSTRAVGGYPANALGLFDMHGNVWEWCAERYGPYPRGAVVNPVGPLEEGDCLFRGGGWSHEARDCRAARRNAAGPGTREDFLGFRLFRSLPPARESRE